MTKLYKERIRTDFLWRSVEYSGSWYECPRVLKLARFLVGGSKWFRACVGASLVTLARPSTLSSLRITDRSFQYASPRLWNQLPAPLRQPRTNLSNSASPSCTSGTSSIGSVDSPLSSFITPSLFHSRLKTFLFCKSFPP